MKLHAHTTDPNYNVASMFLKIYVDGVLQNLCIFADSDAGVIERYKRGDDGLLILDGDNILTEKVHGTVTFSVMPHEQHAHISDPVELLDFYRKYSLVMDHAEAGEKTDADWLREADEARKEGFVDDAKAKELLSRLAPP